MHKKYELIIFWSEEDGIYLAEVPDLPGCSAHGDSPDAALASCQEAIEHWLATAEEFGRTIPEPKRRGVRLG